MEVSGPSLAVNLRNAFERLPKHSPVRATVHSPVARLLYDTYCISAEKFHVTHTLLKIADLHHSYTFNLVIDELLCVCLHVVCPGTTIPRARWGVPRCVRGMA